MNEAPAKAPPTFRYTIPFEDLGVTGLGIAVSMGYREDNLPALFAEQLDRLAAEAGAHACVRCGFRFFPTADCGVYPEGFRIGGTRFNAGAIIAEPLQESESFALFVASAGPGITAWSNGFLADGDYPQAYFVDALGSVTAEKAADWLEEQILDWAGEQEWGTTNRYSPGYCGWDVSEQHQLFSLLPNDFCGVSLTESALMRPTKSVSGVIGIGRAAEKRPYACSTCTMEHCYRRQSELRPV